MQPHFSTNFETQTYYPNEPRFNGFIQNKNLPKWNKGAYIINLDEYDGIKFIGLLYLLKTMLK